MIAVQLIPKEVWEAKLREMGCSRVFERSSALLAAEVWQTNEGRWFTVPVEDGSVVEKWAFDRVLDDIRRLKPLDWDT
jgi:hypothetical protein